MSSRPRKRVRPRQATVLLTFRIRTTHVKKIVVTLCIALLAGTGACAKLNVGGRYTMDAASGQGLAVFSFTANDRVSNFYLQYHAMGGAKPRGDITLWTVQNPLDWRDPRGRLVVIELPAGEYELYNVAGPALQFSASEPFSIPFTIEPGRVKYLGNVHVVIETTLSAFWIRVTDRAALDLGTFLERYPRLSTDDVDVAVTGVVSGP